MPILTELLAHGADSSARTHTRKPASDIAIKNGHHNAAILLGGWMLELSIPRMGGDASSTSTPQHQQVLMRHLESLVGRGGPSTNAVQHLHTVEAGFWLGGSQIILPLRQVSVLSIMRRSAASGCPVCQLILDRVGGASCGRREFHGTLSPKWYDVVPTSPSAALLA